MISVITITRNNFEDLRRTLDSLAIAPNVESIVINGGSCTATLEILSNHPGKVINEPDQGISDAFNKGLREASGIGVAYLNAGDQLIQSEYYVLAEAALSKTPFVYADLIFDDPTAGPIKMKARENFDCLGKGMPFPHPTLVVRREEMMKLGGFSLSYRIAMDFEFTLRLLASAPRGQYLPVTAVRMDGRGVSSSRESEALLECRRALTEAGLFTGKNRQSYYGRWARYQARRFLGSNTVGQALLAAVKSVKSSLR